MKKNILFFLFLLSTICVAQQSKIDSLLNFLKYTKQDTNRVNVLNAISLEYTSIASYETARNYAQNAQALAEKIHLPNEEEIGWPKGIAYALNRIGVTYMNQGDYKLALEKYSQSLKIYEKIGNEVGKGNEYNNFGLVYWNQGDIEKALENHLKSLKIMETVGNKRGIANSYNNIGLLYEDQGNHDQALKNYNKSIKARDDKQWLALCYNNIGAVYEQQGVIASTKTMANDKYLKALDIHFKSLKLNEEMENKQGIGLSYSNIGTIYFDLGKIAPNKTASEKYYEKALENSLRSLQIAKEIGNKKLVCYATMVIGGSYLSQNKLEKSYDYFNQALKLAKEIGDKPNIASIYSSLSDLYYSKHDYKQAFEYHKLFTNLQDTLLNESTIKQVAETNAKYDTEKKDKELIRKDAKIAQQQAVSEKQQLQRNSFIAGFGLVLLLALFILRSYRNKKEANSILEVKNEAISKQNIEIEKKNTLITDSIEYAKNIQQAILPTSEEIKKHFQNYFILYKPKDIVSGDFYWIHHTPSPLGRDGEGSVILAVADCTGHGVPGAFMSLMGNNLLKEIVASKTTPSEILDELNLKILKTLKQDNTTTSAKYGMDIALISLDKKKNTIEYAGAHNPLYIYRNLPAGQAGKECIQLKADERSIGGFLIEEANKFTNQKFELQKGDMLYLFSDGYVDQKGGPEGKKFFSKRFRELLQSICEQDVMEQREQLNTTIVNWKGKKRQMDDILVVGIKV